MADVVTERIFPFLSGNDKFFFFLLVLPFFFFFFNKAKQNIYKTIVVTSGKKLQLDFDQEEIPHF